MAISHKRIPNAQTSDFSKKRKPIHVKRLARRKKSDEVKKKNVTLVENLLYARPSGAVHLMGNLAPA